MLIMLYLDGSLSPNLFLERAMKRGAKRQSSDSFNVVSPINCVITDFQIHFHDGNCSI